MNVPAITEDRAPSFTRNRTGYKGARVFKVVAFSQLHALALLQAEKEVGYALPFDTTWAEGQLQANFIYRELVVEVAANAAPGHTGLFKVTAKASTTEPAGSASEPEPDPDAAAVFSYRFASYSGFTTQNLEEQTIRNSIGQVQRFPVQIPEATVRAVWFKRSIAPGVPLQVAGSVNEREWLGGAAKRWKADGLLIDPIDGIFRCEGNFKYREIGWKLRGPDEARQEIISGSLAAGDAVLGLKSVTKGGRAVEGASTANALPLNADGSFNTDPNAQARMIEQDYYKTFDFNTLVN